MKTLSRCFLGFLMILCMTLSIPSVSFAEGTTMIDLSNKAPSVGDKITMTVSGSDSSTITIKFNSSVLNFSSCNVSGYSAEGNTVTFTAKDGAVEFVAATEGSSNLIVSSDSLTGSSTTLSVSGSSTESDTSSESDNSTETETTEEQTSQETTTDSNNSSSSETSYDFMYGDTAYVISKRFTESQIPKGFQSTTVTIHEKEVKAVSNDAMTLLYLKLASDTYGEGSFFVYDASSDSVSPLMMLGSAEDYVIVQTPAEMPSTLFVETTFAKDEVTYSAYQINGLQNAFYYVYGVDENGAQGWFLYDSEEDTLSRANADAFSYLGQAQDESSTDVATDTDDTNKEESFLSNIEPRNIIAVLVLVLAVVVVIVINVMISKRRDDEEEEVFEEESIPQNREKAPVKKAEESTKTLDEIVNEADDVTPSDEDDEEEEEEEKRGFFFHRRKREDDDIWAESDEEEDDEEDEDKDDDDDKNPPGNSTPNHEINLMDLNNL